MLVLGFMSGTSLDGVDAAVIDTDGEKVLAFGPAVLEPYSDREREAVLAATREALVWNGHGAQPRSFAVAGQLVIDAHLRAVDKLLAKTSASSNAGQFTLAAFHGQTVLHRPDVQLTVQIGNPQVLAKALGVPVVADMRQADLAAGGEGAPLVPLYHQALARRVSGETPLAFLNVGGVANLTWIGVDGRLVAHDTGPGNGLIDLLVQARGQGQYDVGGQLAAAGTADTRLVAQYMASEYFTRSGPKSLDRFDFPLEPLAELSTEDAAATLVAFTAAAVAHSAQTLPSPPNCWYVCGGGRHNPELMRVLGSLLGKPCVSVDDHGLRGDFIEAEAMAFLAVRSVRGLPLTLPETTGVSVPTTGGVRYDP
jgi:anhydro-N-acetylmuramic acid kinase